MLVIIEDLVEGLAVVASLWPWDGFSVAVLEGVVVIEVWAPLESLNHVSQVLWTRMELWILKLDSGDRCKHCH